MKTEYTIREFVEAAVAKSYSGTFPQRLKLACSFMNFYKSIHNTKDEKRASAFMNPDTITFKEITVDGSVAYGFNDFIEPSKEMLAQDYNNYDFASRTMLAKAEEYVSKKKVNPKNSDLRNICDEISKLQIASYIVFYILFGCHPFKCKDYYDKLVYTEKENLAYFRRGRFIFAQNEIIEGYHNLPNDLWNKLTINQSNVFVRAFNAGSGKSEKRDNKAERRYNKFDDFYSAWSRSYRYELIELRAPCAEIIPAIAFGEKKVLIATDVAIWEDRALCNKCNKNVYDKCKECTHNTTGIVEVTTLRAKVTVDNSYIGKKATESVTKELLIRVGVSVTGRDIDDKNGGFDKVFTVISTKTRGTLGIEYNGEKPIYVTYPNGQEGFFKTGSKLKIGSGMVIQLAQNVTVEFIDKKTKEAPKKIEEPKGENANG